jgi:peptidoglycan/xylan/chitin deacetylase (PgdA/CDA1 family)
VSVDGRWSEQGAHAAVGKSLSDPGNRWCSPHGIDRVPYTIVVDPSGVIRWSSSGVLRSSDVVDAVRSAMSPDSSTGTIYLTFDDYPAPQLNDELLDVLRREDVPATFFCICSRLMEFRAQMERTVAEGHELEIHGWHHDEPAPPFEQCQRALAKFGTDGTLYRAHGSESIVVIGSGKTLTHAVIDPYDYQRPGAKELIRRITNQLRPGAVVQLHAGVRDTVEALPGIIENARKRGFQFGRLRKR